MCKLQAIMIGCGSIGGFGFQALYGTLIVLARLVTQQGSVWSAPAYFYLTTASTTLGIGETDSGPRSAFAWSLSCCSGTE